MINSASLCARPTNCERHREPRVRPGIHGLPTARDLWRAITLIALVVAVLGIVRIEAFRRYFPCNSS
jgi:hypothetical protein